MKKEKDLQKRFQKPAQWKTGNFTNKRGQSIRKGELATHFNPVANIIILPGLSEFAEKFYELAAEFNKQGCNVYTFDPIGQGYSDRILQGSLKQHCTDMNHDVDDLIEFRMDHVPDNAPTIVFGHSTGGLVAFRAAQERPELFDGLTLTAPLFGVHAFPAAGNEHIIARLPLPKKLKESYAPGQGPWKPRADESNTLTLDDFTNDPDRQTLHDDWVEIDDRLKTDDVTWGWLLERCKGIVAANKDHNIAKLDMPFVIATAGKDQIVHNKGTEKIIDKLQKVTDVTHIHCDDSGHEMYLETDAVRTPIIEETIKMINSLKGKKGFSPK